ncbi:MAG: hypothetical protein WDZ31_03430 [Phycisphaeraceae bacterium]
MMWHTKPICLTLVLLLALWTPAGACCGLAMADMAETASHTESAPSTLPPCHEPPASDTTPAPSDPCDDGQCTCGSPALSACQTQPAETKAFPAPADPLPTALLVPTPIQPQAMLPHTFFTRHGGPEDAASPPPPAPTLLALNCQLTL